MTADSDGLGKEFEILASEMETRLRGHILRLVRPTLDHTADMSSRLDELASRVDKHEDLIGIAEVLRGEVSQQKEMSRIIQESIDKRDHAMRDFESKSNEQHAQVNFNVREVEDKLEKIRGESRKQSRDIERIWEETSRLLAFLEEQSERSRTETETLNRRTEKTREEILAVVEALQGHHNALMDELFGEDRVLAKLRSDIKALDFVYESLPAAEKKLGKAARDIEILQEKAEKTTGEILDHKDIFEDFTKKNEADFKLLRDDAKIRANQLTAHHAAIMGDIRNDYIEEINAARNIRKEVSDIQVKTIAFCDKLSKNSDSEAARIDSLSRELREDMEDLHRKRKKDRTNVDGELFELRRDQHSTRDFSQTLRVSVEYLGRIIGLVLEGEKLACAMSIQDYTDRKAERWMVLPDMNERPAQPPATAEQLTEQHRQGVQVDEEDGRLHPVDWRKGLALDSYKPGPVAFRGVPYKRRELLLLHHKLLHKAHKAYSERWSTTDATAMRGNTANIQDVAEYGSVRGQPCANGGMSAGRQVQASQSDKLWPLPTKPASVEFGDDDDDSRLKAHLAASRANAGSRQRPGSQGQPSAGGSRGTMHGSLGETEPPLGMPAYDGLDGPTRTGILSPRLDGPTRTGKTPPLKLPGLAGERADRSSQGDRSSRGDDKWGTMSTAPGSTRPPTSSGGNGTATSLGPLQDLQMAAMKSARDGTLLPTLGKKGSLTAR